MFWPCSILQTPTMCHWKMMMMMTFWTTTSLKRLRSKQSQVTKVHYCTFIFLLSAFLQNFFLCQDRCNDDVSPHLVQPWCVALGWALDSRLISRLELRAVSIGILFPNSRFHLVHLDKNSCFHLVHLDKNVLNIHWGTE